MFGFDLGSIAKGVMEGVVGPLFGWLGKKQDVDLEKFKVDGQVDLGLLTAYRAQLSARRDLLLAQQAHFGGRAMQYLFVYPLGIWWAGIIVYCILQPWLPWWQPVRALPENILPWGAGMVTFLFLGSKIDGWVRRT